MLHQTSHHIYKEGKIIHRLNTEEKVKPRSEKEEKTPADVFEMGGKEIKI